MTRRITGFFQPVNNGANNAGAAVDADAAVAAANNGAAPANNAAVAAVNADAGEDSVSFFCAQLKPQSWCRLPIIAVHLGW